VWHQVWRLRGWVTWRPVAFDHFPVPVQQTAVKTKETPPGERAKEACVLFPWCPERTGEGRAGWDTESVPGKGRDLWYQVYHIWASSYMHLYASYFDVQMLFTHSHASRCLMQTTKTEIVGLKNLPITEVFGGSKPVPHFASLKSPCLTDPPFENCFTSPCLSVYTCLRPILPVDIYPRCCCHAQVFWDLLLLLWLRINN
jgi:hypothetical protein